MYGLLLENGQRVRKHADQLKLRIETDNDAVPTEDSDQLDSGMGPDGNETDSPTEQPEQPDQPEQPEPLLMPTRSSRIRKEPDRYGYRTD